MASIVALLIYSITFSIYKRKRERFSFPLLLLLVICVVITLLMAAYAEKYVKMYIVGPIYMFSVFAYPALSSALLVRKTAQYGKQRLLFFVLGVLSSILYTAVFLLLLNAKK